jgi:hypothetical protein
MFLAVIVKPIWPPVLTASALAACEIRHTI